MRGVDSNLTQAIWFFCIGMAAEALLFAIVFGSR